MTRRGSRRRADSTSLLPRLVPLGWALALAVLGAFGALPTRAQPWSSPIDSIAHFDSVAHAESLRVRDSTQVADSLAAEEEAAFAEAAGSFGGSRTILDRPHPGGALSYSSNYSINRSNRNWGQSADFKFSPGRVEVANLTTVTIGRENSVGRINRNRQTRTELAYRVSHWLRLGGGLGLQRISDQARTNFTPIEQDNDDASAQARFNSQLGAFPLRGLVSYGYLKNDQRQQQSKGNSANFYASTSRSWGAGSSVSLDASQQLSRLTSTVPDDSTYLQDDRNSNRDFRLVSNFRLNRWANLDFTGSSQHSRIERPARIALDPLDPDSLTVQPERISGRNESADGSLRIQLPRSGSVTVRGSRSANRQVYSAESDRSSIASRTSFAADANPPLRFMTTSVSYENTLNENDYTRRDPGYVETTLLRRLDGNASRGLGPRTTARFNAGASLSRRRYGSYFSSGGAPAPSDQDQLRLRGSLNLSYRPDTRFDTGLQLAIEDNKVVNISRTSSTNNSRQRSYAVTWTWNAKPGSIWSVSQTDNATAVQQYFDFTPDRDQLSFIYNLNTTLTTQLSRTVRLDTQHTARIQSRGSWRFVEARRSFGKSNEFNTFDLNLRAVYQPKSWLTLEAQERLTSSPNYTFARGEGSKSTESRRTEFTLVARTNYTFSPHSSLTGDVRRILSTDRSRTFGAVPSDRATDNDYWFGTISFRMEFFP